MGTIHVPPNSVKHRFLGKFGSHNTIHTFKNYFATVFLANKRYLNTPLVWTINLCTLSVKDAIEEELVF